MRTGNPINSCAIFWRASRFKLFQEECIEFNKLGLPYNVAQICVLELVSENETGNTAHQSASSAGSTKIVVCNIHEPYNPKRGEIKLGQGTTNRPQSSIVDAMDPALEVPESPMQSAEGSCWSVEEGEIENDGEDEDPWSCETPPYF